MKSLDTVIILVSLANIASGQKSFDVGAAAGHSTGDA